MTLDFGKPEAAGAINAWVKAKTNGKIAGIVTPEELSGPATVRGVVLTNAVYFKGEWYEPFSQQATRDQPFMLADGSSKTAPLMQREELAGYYHGDGIELTELHYRGSVTMYFLLPERGRRINDTLIALTPETWLEWRARMGAFDRTLLLPRFTVEYATDLDGTLSHLGITSVFQYPAADLTPMGLPREYFATRVKHKTYLKVDEKGTEAAAATAMFGAGGYGGPEPEKVKVTFRADRPFLCIIEENNTGAILLMGAINDPTPGH